MITTRTIGGARVTNVVEYVGPTHDAFALFPDIDSDILERHTDWLGPAHWAEPSRRLIVTIQTWIVRVGSSVILIDTGVGNHKPRPVTRMDRLNTLFPEWMAAAGVRFEDVTHVVMTHLHTDHVGWNTVHSGDGWVPTFPNARYLLPEADLDYFRDLYEVDPGTNVSFADSVQPILDAGLVEFIGEGMEVAGALRVTDATGHTPGQINLWLGEGADSGVFCADIFHSPIQIAEPQLNTAFCVIPEAAKATRLAFLERVADTGTLVMPFHFGPPHCGRVVREAGGFAFVPEPHDERRMG